MPTGNPALLGAAPIYQHLWTLSMLRNLLEGKDGLKEQRTRKTNTVTQSISYFGLLLVTGSEEL